MKENKVRRFAKEARARLLMNSYDKPQKKVPSDRVFKISEDPKDAILYSQIVEIAKNNDIVTDPLGRLIDRSLFSTLSDNEKLKYVFRLANKYSTLLEKYRSQEISPMFQYAAIIHD